MSRLKPRPTKMPCNDVMHPGVRDTGEHMPGWGAKTKIRAPIRRGAHWDTVGLIDGRRFGALLFETGGFIDGQDTDEASHAAFIFEADDAVD